MIFLGYFQKKIIDKSYKKKRKKDTMILNTVHVFFL